MRLPQPPRNEGEVLPTLQALIRQLQELTRSGSGSGNGGESGSAGVAVGTMMPFAGLVVPPGFLLCDGALYLRQDYVQLFNVIGTLWAVGGEPAESFRVPNMVGRVARGGANVGTYVGADSIQITQTHLPNYALSVIDPGHIHALNDPGHIHGLTQNPHIHTINDPGHAHTPTDPGHVHSSLVNGGAGTAGGGNNLTTGGNTGSATTGITIQSAPTGITVNGANADISVQSASTGLSVQSVEAGITVNLNGGGTPLPTIPAAGVVLWIIRAF